MHLPLGRSKEGFKDDWRWLSDRRRVKPLHDEIGLQKSPESVIWGTPPPAVPASNALLTDHVPGGPNKTICPWYKHMLQAAYCSEGILPTSASEKGLNRE